MKAPLWSRVLYRLSRALNSVNVSQEILRDELLFAFLQPSQRTTLTLDAYGKSRGYVSGGEIFSQGLFPWESALLDDSRIPRSGRVLLAAAGGGRELKALIERRYEVSAFEPVAPFFESARAVARGSSSVVVNATYEDLVAHAAGQHGPLAGWQAPFDFCVLGWGSLSHLTEPDVVVDVLRALRAVVPRGPIMTSFFAHRSSPAPGIGGARTLRRAVKRTLEVVGGRRVPPGLRFLTSGGFVYSFSREELLGLCDQAGYEVALYSESDYPHALLVPKAAAPVEPASGA